MYIYIYIHTYTYTYIYVYIHIHIQYTMEHTGNATCRGKTTISLFIYFFRDTIIYMYRDVHICVYTKNETVYICICKYIQKSNTCMHMYINTQRRV